MEMTLEDFIDLAMDNYYNCTVWDNEKEEVVYEGTIINIPNELLGKNFTSWEIDNNIIGFNVD